MARRRRGSRSPVAATSQLRLAELRSRENVEAKLMNVVIPADTMRGIEAVSAETGSTKTDAVIALLNEGMAVWAELAGGWQQPERNKMRKRRGQPPAPIPPTAA